MNAAHARKHIGRVDTYAQARILIEQGLRVLPIRSPLENTRWNKNPGKTPCWDLVLEGRPLIDNMKDFELWLEPHAERSGAGPLINLAIVENQVAQVDCDTTEALELVRRYGVELEGAVWIVRTGRGWKFFYRNPEDPRLHNRQGVGGCECHSLPDIEPEDEHGGLDLICSTPAVCPPSIHKTGALYRWSAGHSPADIPYKDLETPPPGILDRWLRGLEARPQTFTRSPVRQSPDLETALRSVIKGLQPGRDGWERGHCPFPNHGKGRGDRGRSFSINFELGGFKCFAGDGQGTNVQLADRLGVIAPRADRNGVDRPFRGRTRD